jgi:hypothetical protein
VARRSPHLDPFEALVRGGNAQQLLDFFTRAEERLTSAFPRAARTLAESDDPSAKQVRGSTRRHYLHQALLTAARDARLPVQVSWTEPATWSYPVAKIGAFSLTIGIVETKYRGQGRSLRTRSKYIEKLCARNAPLNPQGELFDGVKSVNTVIPDGAFGGLIVAQFRPHQPEVPAFLGFWVPSEKLSRSYYVRSFDEVITMLRDRLTLERRPSKKVVQRKVVRRRINKPDGKQG